MKNTPTIRLCVVKPTLYAVTSDESLDPFEPFEPYYDVVGEVVSINFKKGTIRVRYKIPGGRSKTITTSDSAFWQKYQFTNYHE